MNSEIVSCSYTSGLWYGVTGITGFVIGRYFEERNQDYANRVTTIPIIGGIIGFFEVMVILFRAINRNH